MDIFRNFSTFKKLIQSNDSIALTFGNFDGVHLGHQEIFKKLTSYPIRIIVTFDSSLPKRLTLAPQKLDIFSRMNLFTACYLIPFTPKLSTMSYEEFLTLLKEKTNFSHLFLGEDAAFGCHREGTKEKIFDLEKKLSFSFFPIPLKKDAEGNIISSSLIRNFCEQKKFKECSHLLGRPLAYLFEEPLTEDANELILNAEKYCLPFSGSYLMKFESKDELFSKEVSVKIQDQTICISKKNLSESFHYPIQLIPLFAVSDSAFTPNQTH